MKLIQESLFGVDVNPTACRIAAFSLYLAYLDHLSPRDIQQLQQEGRALPRLVSDESQSRNITCADFFDDSVIHAWIHAGDLKAVNVAQKRSGRPRWRILDEHLEEFLRSRQNVQPTPSRRRKTRAYTGKQYF